MRRFVWAIVAMAAVCGLGDSHLSAESPPNGYESKSIAMKFALVPSGTFEMGSLESSSNLVTKFRECGAEASFFAQEFPAHEVTISKGFYLGVYEVTQREYARVMRFNPSSYSPTGEAKKEVDGIDTTKLPVEQVSWFDAVEFCNKLSSQDGLPLYYSLSEIKRNNRSIGSASVTIVGGNGYRLPTEAEWEYACRAGTKSSYSSGDSVDSLGHVAWYGRCGASIGNSSGRPHKVGEKKGNNFGLFDMHGNVDEWCADVYDLKAYHKRAGEVKDPLQQATDAPLQFRVIRGGAWLPSPMVARSSSRSGWDPGGSGIEIGFRVARTAP